MDISSPVHKLFSNNSPDSSKDLQDNGEDNPIYERANGQPIIHDGEQCRKFGCRTCTPKSIVEELDERRRQYFKKCHKGRNERARIKQTAQSPAPSQQWDPKYSEDFD